MKLKKNIYFKLIVVFAVIFSITLLIVLFKNNIIQKELIANPIEKHNMLAVNSSTWDTNKVTVYTDSNGAVVPIPKGYAVSGVSGENVVNTGLVIYQGTDAVTSSNVTTAKKTRNQWVWIPVNDVSRIYEETNGVKKSKLWTFTSTGRTANSNGAFEPGIAPIRDNEYYFSRYNLQSLTRIKFYQELQVEFENTIKSIQKYGGFYIGRYETGSLSKKIPVVQRLNTDIGTKNFYAVYNNSKYLASNVNVKTNIIFGSLWDETLQWLVDTGIKTYSQIASDSTSWGNHKNATFSYTNSSGGTSTKSSGSTLIVPSGSSEYTKANNIYDMAGNIWDCTLECDAYVSRRSRGGSYNHPGSTYPAAHRDYFYTETEIYDSGYRSYLYIK